MIKYKQLYISLRNKISKYNAKQSHDIVTNNKDLPNIKRFLPYQIKIIPWPHARLGDDPRAVPLMVSEPVRPETWDSLRMF
jgi:hypothetical protein